MTKETNKGSVRVERVMSASVNYIWSLLTDSGNASALLGSGAAARFDEKKGNPCFAAGKLRVDGQIFTLKMRPFDVLAENEQGRMALRLAETVDGRTRVTAAVACAEGITGPGRDDIGVFLDRLERLVDRGPVKTAASDDGAGSARAVGTQSAKKRTTKKSAARRGIGLLAALLVIAAAVGMLLIIKPWGGKTATTEIESAAGADDLSPAVCESAAQTLGERFAEGISRSKVESLLGTKGIRTDDGAQLYRSETLNGLGQPTVQIKAVYEGGRLSSYTYLNLDNAQQIGVVDVDGDINSYPVSMERRYFSNGEVIYEKHVGYVDPFANFSSSWRGEIAVVTNETTGESSSRKLKGYDGSDPLMISSLEGHAVADQYDDYDTFLADKLECDTAMLMLKGYSRGDVRHIFGEYEAYDGGSGIEINSIFCKRFDTDAEPVYTYSFKFDTAGAFDQSSFVNTSLFDKAGTLAHCKPDAAWAGQSYGEIRRLMPILPTAIYVTQSHLTVCYGRYIGGNELAHQFELVAVFNRETMIAESVYSNVISDSTAQ